MGGVILNKPLYSFFNFRLKPTLDSIYYRQYENINTAMFNQDNTPFFELSQTMTCIISILVGFVEIFI